MYSNFNLASDGFIDAVLESGLDELNISFNGSNKDSYEKTMSINYEKTLKNLNKLLALKKEKNSDLKVRLSMALVRYNENNIREFMKEWAGKVDSVSVNRTHTYGGRVEDVLINIKLILEKKYILANIYGIL